MSRVLGIDPGIEGGWAILEDDGSLVSAGALPVAGAGAQRMVSAALFRTVIEQYRPARAIVELVSAMPKQGVSSSFKFGRSVGVVEGVIGGANIPIQWVSAAKWKRAMNLSTDKEQSRQRAIQEWPHAAGLHFSRKKDHGPAEAALIALYSKRAA